jgi:hypothetical protein
MGGPTVTEAEKTELWNRRGEGESMSAIARHLGRGLETIRRYVLVSGGRFARGCAHSGISTGLSEWLLHATLGG